MRHQTNIYNASGELHSTGRNLAIVFNYARARGGVQEIRVVQCTDGGAMVNVLMAAPGAPTWRAEVYFVDYSHACEWAYKRSARRGTYWTGCAVVCTSADNNSAEG